MLVALYNSAPLSIQPNGPKRYIQYKLLPKDYPGYNQVQLQNPKDRTNLPTSKIQDK